MRRSTNPLGVSWEGGWSVGSNEVFRSWGLWVCASWTRVGGLSVVGLLFCVCLTLSPFTRLSG